MLSSKDFPDLVDFMTKCLFQDAAPTFDDAILAWTVNDEASIRSVIEDIERLLNAHYSLSELDEFVDQYSEYGEEGGGRATLEYIRGVLIAD